MIKLLVRYALIGLLLASVSPVEALSEPLQNQDPIVIDLREIENDGKRVEVQRYIGYENLLFRYLTLPYDVSTNTSNQGRYFDIGYVILAIFPIALLLFYYRNKKVFYTSLVLLLLYLGICLSYSFVNIKGQGPIYTNSENWTSLTHSETRTSLQSLLVALYDAGQFITSPVRSLIDNISGESDHLTYPLLFVLLLTFVFIITRTARDKKQWTTLLLISGMFFFLWLLLSGGIIWYGFLLIPIFLAIGIKVLTSNTSRNVIALKPFLIVLAPVVIWIFCSFSARVGGIDVFTPEADKGKGIVDSKLIYYSTALHSEKEAVNLVYNRVGNAIDKINADDGLIYQVGTSMAFDIKNNPSRVFQDNVLTTFFQILNKYRNNKIITDVLKASGFRYIIVDLYTQTLDKTPEKSLTKKYQLFLSALYESKNINLLATDRIIDVQTSQGQSLTVNDVFVRNYSSEDKVNIRNHGSYAIYEIL